MAGFRRWLCCWNAFNGDEEHLKCVIRDLRSELRDTEDTAHKRALQRQQLIKEKDEMIKNYQHHITELETYVKLADNSTISVPMRVVVVHANDRLLDVFITPYHELIRVEDLLNFYFTEVDPELRRRQMAQGMHLNCVYVTICFKDVALGGSVTSTQNGRQVEICLLDTEFDFLFSHTYDYFILFSVPF